MFFDGFSGFTDTFGQRRTYALGFQILPSEILGLFEKRGRIPVGLFEKRGRILKKWIWDSIRIPLGFHYDSIGIPY